MNEYLLKFKVKSQEVTWSGGRSPSRVIMTSAVGEGNYSDIDEIFLITC